MGKKVYANGMEIAHKAGAGKVIAAFPDVCNSPPAPPAGPIPVPYPNTSKAGDLKKGSKQVRIGGKPVALEMQSYYATKPLGDEAATKTLGGSLMSHTSVGKTYFQAYSMTVVFEGKHVCRHLDLTTSNHASYPGSTPPMPNTESQALALARIDEGKCPCCGSEKHADGEPMSMEEWYDDNLQQRYEARVKELDEKMEKAKAAYETSLNGHPKGIAKCEKQIAAIAVQYSEESLTVHRNKSDIRNLIHRAKLRPGCTCAEPKPSLLPSPPCDVFFERPPPGPERDERQKAIVEAWDTYRKKHVGKSRTPKALIGVKKGQQVNHLTPKSAGGCPTGDGNLQADAALCAACQAIDDEFNPFQS